MTMIPFNSFTVQLAFFTIIYFVEPANLRCLGPALKALSKPDFSQPQHAQHIIQTTVDSKPPHLRLRRLSAPRIQRFFTISIHSCRGTWPGLSPKRPWNC